MKIDDIKQLIIDYDDEIKKAQELFLQLLFISFILIGLLIFILFIL